MLSLALTGLLAACHAAPATPHARDAWVRLPAVPGRPGAAYLTIEGGNTSARVTAVDSAAAGASELHESMGRGGMMTMRPLAGVDVPAHGQVRFAPQGDHVMLFGLDPRLAPGATVPLTVRFASGRPIAVTAKAVAAGDAPPY